MAGSRTIKYLATVSVCLLLTVTSTPALPQSANLPWYGVPLPPAFSAHTITAIVGNRGPASAVVPTGEEQFDELRGDRLLQDLHAIIAFSHASREQQELGGNQMWGRVAGFPSGEASGEGGGYRAAGVPIITTMQAPRTDINP